MILKMTNGDRFEAVANFGNGRAIVNVGGAFVLAVLTAQGWDTDTGEPARPGIEKDTLNGLVKDGTTVEVTRPDGSTTFFEDP